ncbi:MAG: site-specific integrase [Faecalibacterium sp.]|jgi:integrase|nr:site-specific integrase [Faecalibacterium sp.]
MTAKKRSAQGSGSIKHRADGRWEARYVLGHDPATGKAIRKSVYGSTQQDVRRVLAAAVQMIDTHTYKEQAKTTVGAWLDFWYKTYCDGILKRYTLMSYESIIRLHLKPALAAIRLCDLTTDDIQKLVQKLQRQGKSPKTVKNVCGCLSAAIEQAKGDGRIMSNPCEYVKYPKAAQKEVQPLTVEQMTALLNAAAGDSYEDVFFICLFCGLRKGEALGLSWRQVDFESNHIIVDQQLQHTTQNLGGYYIMAGTKNGKARMRDVPPFIMDRLHAVKQRQLLDQLKAGRAWANEWGLVFTDALGGHLHHMTMQKHFKRVATAAGVPDARVHDLRHSFATLSLANGDDVKTVQANLGHATAAFTLQRYIHTSEQMKKDSAQRLQDFYEKSIEKKA